MDGIIKVTQRKTRSYDKHTCKMLMKLIPSVLWMSMIFNTLLFSFFANYLKTRFDRLRSRECISYQFDY